jgi:transposase
VRRSDLYRRSGRPLTEIARDLGIATESLRTWVRQAAVDAGEQPGLASGELEELRRLRRENHVLREERTSPTASPRSCFVSSAQHDS